MAVGFPVGFLSRSHGLLLSFVQSTAVLGKMGHGCCYTAVAAEAQSVQSGSTTTAPCKLKFSTNHSVLQEIHQIFFPDPDNQCLHMVHLHSQPHRSPLVALAQIHPSLNLHPNISNLQTPMAPRPHTDVVLFV